METILNSELLNALTNASPDSGLGMAVMVITIVIGLILCFLGLKMMRIVAALIGIGAGAFVGAVIGGLADISGFTLLILSFGCAVVLAIVAFFVYRVGIFLFTFVTFAVVLTGVLGTGSQLHYLIACVVGLVIAVLSVVYRDPLVIVATSVLGGLLSGDCIAKVAGMENSGRMGFVIGGVIAIVGMIVQYLMYRHRLAKNGGKKEKDEDLIDEDLQYLEDGQKQKKKGKKQKKEKAAAAEESSSDLPFDDIEMLDDDEY